MTVRFGLVGCGRIAEAHARAIQDSEGARLVAAADPDPHARARAVDRWGCVAYERLEDMLAEQELDAASVCAPPALHRALAERLLDAGLDVLCEKPMATRSEDARRMRDRAAEAGRVLAVSSKFRFVDDLHEARRRIAEGAIGRPLGCEVRFCSPTVLPDWALRPETSGGGVVMDNGPHAFDVLSVVLPGTVPKVVGAVFGPPTAHPGIEDTAEILVRVDGGPVGRIALSWTYSMKDPDYLLVHGSEGILRVGWTGAAVGTRPDQGWEPFGTGYDKAGAFREQLGAFLTAVEERKGSGSAATGVAALEFVEAVYDRGRSAAVDP